MGAPRKDGSREAWDKLYEKHGLQFGGSGDAGPLERFLRKDMLVLDAGCGEGKTLDILSRNAEVVGCDFSRRCLIAFRSRSDGDRKVNLVECNLTSLPFAREKFDAVACVHSLSHLLLDDRRRAADQCSEALVPGGHLFIEGFGRGDLRFGSGSLVEQGTFVRGNGIMTHYFEEGEMARLFDKLTLISEAVVARRVAYGPRAGRREVIRALFRRQRSAGSA